MMQHLLNDLVGHGGDVGTGQGTVGHVHGVAHAGRDDLGLDVGVVEEHVVDGLNELDAPLGDIVQAPQEGADVGGTGAGGQQRLADKALMALRPSAVMGIFTTMCLGSRA